MYSSICPPSSCNSRLQKEHTPIGEAHNEPFGTFIHNFSRQWVRRGLPKGPGEGRVVFLSPAASRSKGCEGRDLARAGMRQEEIVLEERIGPEILAQVRALIQEIANREYP